MFHATEKKQGEVKTRFGLHRHSKKKMGLFLLTPLLSRFVQIYLITRKRWKTIDGRSC